MGPDSWIRKFARAEEHLDELKAMIGPVGQRQQYPVSERFETYENVRQWVYRVDLGADLDDDLPIVAGDFLFNVRSGLDHRAASLVPADKKWSVQFPIFADDPLAMDADQREHINKQAWRAWKGAIKPFPESAATALTDLQPFKAAAKTGNPAQWHTLDILRTLHDADEHKSLFVAERGVRDGEVIVNGIGLRGPSGSSPENGAVIHFSPAKVQVQLIGTPFVALGVSGDRSDEGPVPGAKRRWPLPETFDTILVHIAETVLPALEGLLIYPDTWRS
jgi:hypothetical protein